MHLAKSCVALSLFMLTLARPAYAQASGAKKPRAQLNISGAVIITYGSPSWNIDSTKIDVAHLILRDATSGRIVKIQLEETEPDSSQFTGQFSLSIAEQTKIVPEVYVPPQDLRTIDKDSMRIYELIKSGKLSRKPLVWKRNDHGQSLLAVYDTREQAEAGLKKYEDEQRLAEEIRHKRPNAVITNAVATAAAQTVERKTVMEKAAAEEAKNNNERAQLEQREREAEAERERKAREMSEAEREEHQEQAAEFNESATQLYNANEFSLAEAKFKQAVELDPDRKEYFYKYGVTLYRDQKFNEALVALKIAKVPPDLEAEKAFYTGLVYYRLGELQNGLTAFDSVAKSKDSLAPSATFYQGVLLFAQDKYESAKKSFESVIDTSSDPHLDEQAEQYLDRVASAQSFAKLRENKFTITGVVGLIYDTNVLLAPDNSAASATATNISDIRLLTLVDLQYRPIYNEHHELAPHITANLTNSSKSTAAPADPFLYDVAAPYTYKGKALGKDFRLTATPGYELLYMDPNSTGTKAEELAAYFLAIDSTFMMSKDWISIYTLEYRSEQSYDPSSTGPEDLSGKKYTLRTTQTFFVDPARKTALMPTVGLVFDNAKGSNKTYNRYDAGVTYVRPVLTNSNLSVGLSYYQMIYSNTSDPKRIDNDVTFTVGLTKPVRDWVIWGVNGTYTKNSSTMPIYEYSKYVIMTTATFMTNF